MILTPLTWHKAEVGPTRYAYFVQFKVIEFPEVEYSDRTVAPLYIVTEWDKTPAVFTAHDLGEVYDYLERHAEVTPCPEVETA